MEIAENSWCSSLRDDVESLRKFCVKKKRIVVRLYLIRPTQQNIVSQDVLSHVLDGKTIWVERV